MTRDSLFRLYLIYLLVKSHTKEYLAVLIFVVQIINLLLCHDKMCLKFYGGIILLLMNGNQKKAEGFPYLGSKHQDLVE